MSTSIKFLHRAESRGHADHGWLKSYHTFSFAGYFNRERMNFGTLRVLNDDVILGGNGFGTHPHKDMEIISVPLAGALKHKDSVGNEGTIHHGEVQVMSAGTGILHSEFNGSETETAELLQIWILPKKVGVSPRYDQKKFDEEGRKNKFQIIVSPDGRENSLSINQDAFFSLANLSQKQSLSYKRKNSSNGVYIFLIRGDLTVAGETLKERDALGLLGTDDILLTAENESSVLVIEVPMDTH